MIHATAPRLSVVVPTYRRAHLLRRCLAALRAQDLPAREFEILVVDDAGGDPATLAAVQQHLRHPQPRPALRYLGVEGPRHGPARARNLGWRAARAPLIAFTDDDTVPDPEWLRAGLIAIDALPGAAAATGAVIVPRGEPPTDYEREVARLEQAEFVTANCFVRREALALVGGFDERFPLAWREDSDLMFALLQRAGRILRAPAARVVHPVRPAPFGISLREQRKVAYDALLYRKYPDLFRRHIRARPPWHYFCAVLALAGSAGMAALGQALPAALLLATWLALTLRFCARRLAGTSRAPRHVAEMLLTSIAIPPVATFWRLVGAVRYRTLFP